jgi:PKD repeat protein
VDNWLWTFGDGGTATSGPIVNHAYLAPGSFDVSLVVSNTLGSYTINQPHYIVVNPWQLFLPLVSR